MTDLSPLPGTTACPQRLQTERLILRRWRKEDAAPFAKLNADPEVMRFFPSTLTAEESDAMIERIEAGFENIACALPHPAK